MKYTDLKIGDEYILIKNTERPCDIITIITIDKFQDVVKIMFNCRRLINHQIPILFYDDEKIIISNNFLKDIDGNTIMYPLSKLSLCIISLTNDISEKYNQIENLSNEYVKARKELLIELREYVETSKIEFNNKIAYNEELKTYIDDGKN